MLAIDSNNFLRGKNYGFRKTTLNTVEPYNRLCRLRIITSDIFYNYRKGKKTSGEEDRFQHQLQRKL